MLHASDFLPGLPATSPTGVAESSTMDMQGLSSTMQQLVEVQKQQRHGLNQTRWQLSLEASDRLQFAHTHMYTYTYIYDICDILNVSRELGRDQYQHGTLMPTVLIFCCWNEWN